MTREGRSAVLRTARQACVLGLGRSGLGAVELLLAEGARVRALDLAPSAETLARWARYPADRAELIAGPHPPAALEGCDLLVRSPGVPAGAPLLAEARRRGVPIVSEIELAAARASAPLLAITGTNGKSTTTAWTAHLLAEAGRPAIACGNIGHALSRALLAEPPGTILVAEISSFQLEDSPTLRPAAATILNITPDHLDRHGSLAAYAAAKWAIARNQSAGDLLALGPGVAEPADWAPAARRVRFDLDDPGGLEALFVRGGSLVRRGPRGERVLLPLTELALPGPHNALNAMAALALAETQVADPALLLPGLRRFAGLPHRLETVAVAGGVRWVNDSKATNVDSLRVALESFDGPLVLIAGGRDKAGPFEALAAQVGKRVAHLLLIGEAAERIRQAWPGAGAERLPDLAAAVERARALARPGMVVLLSPGCASFDQFRNYEERGDRFRSLVRERVAEQGEG